ncbi:hypothetical protein B5C34_08325 [Pacificimonas flava]|uniref:Peptidase M20 dimerisation domain-containing protein n=2 Tax=Pacificimonas TaxID=1960290 RepID=A0A219B5K8_9SPHN|nr:MULTISPECIES: M20/M25/M40 family metallo-hydrolase [Pacificimonas]MBZ6379332.1 M20/M25/M40 family metallo-hydrolase [Pacificimonas aurantium]OWV33464.1 hypothetical protein B5C34_08325 [Pacificimonas flava]
MIRTRSAAVLSAGISAALLASAVSLPAVAQVQPGSERGTEALDLYRDLISFRTAEGHGQVPAMAERLAQELREAGFSDEDITITPSGETAYMTVRYEGSGEEAPIAFMAHMDVVDALPEDWEHDPFALREEDGFFLGRGAVDNKMGVAHLTRAFAELKASGFVPDRDLFLAFSGDEETGMATTQALANSLAPLGFAYALNSDAGGGALSEDGTALGYGMQVAEKTYATFEVTVTNPGGHSSQPRADNAIYDLTSILQRVAELRFPAMSNEITRGLIRAAAAGEPAERAALMRRFADDPADSEAAAALVNDPKTAPDVSTTCVATMLDAGHAENALPQRATATVNCRIFPGVEVSEVQDRLEELSADIENVTWQALDNPSASPISTPDPEVMAAVKAALAPRYPDVTVMPNQSAGGTDGKWFRKAGIPTFAVSPIFFPPSPVGAHGLNERAPADSFYFGLDYWPALIRDLAAD